MNLNQPASTIPGAVHRWFLDHRMVLFYLPPYSPELNLIEIVWKHAKYHWRRFVNWTKETIDTEPNCSAAMVRNLKSVLPEHLARRAAPRRTPPDRVSGIVPTGFGLRPAPGRAPPQPYTAFAV
ncbi:hypothetical protein EVC45_44425 [Paraburkholderia sp. UYCP14C]|uniref:transposase n=1 Tax=Paraburkholderia sp. UYCP14C TaxID=2511130 RepID=UPI00101EE86F|nr:hypothetical protein EVC45_44425 [Paraburkholderia sp. UYCP14C]